MQHTCVLHSVRAGTHLQVPALALPVPARQPTPRRVQGHPMLDVAQPYISLDQLSLQHQQRTGGLEPMVEALVSSHHRPVRQCNGGRLYRGAGRAGPAAAGRPQHHKGPLRQRAGC